MMDKKYETRREFLIRTFADPVLIYVVIAMMSIMNHYRSSLTFVFGIVTYLAGWAVFRLFDYINKHHFIGTFAYIALFSAFIVFARFAVNMGHKRYPLSWGVWFLTPQTALQYNKWYTYALFALFLIFMLSVIYYFTRVRYRIFMNFLILIIPFSIYGKENEEMKIGYIIALCVGFFIVLAEFRQLQNSEKAVAVDRFEMWKSAAVYTVIFAVAAAVVPKPEIEADRTMIETLINADELTDRFLSMLGSFRDDSSGEVFRSNRVNTPLYIAHSPFPLHIKTSTFSSYNYETDSWKAGNYDSEKNEVYMLPHDMKDRADSEIILDIAENDSDFAEKYGLSEYVGANIGGLKKYDVSFTSINNRGNAAPVPEGAAEFSSTSYEKTTGWTYSGLILAMEGRFGPSEKFDFSVVSRDSIIGGENKGISSYLASMGYDEYSEMLRDAYDTVKVNSDELFDSDDEYIMDVFETKLAIRSILDECVYISQMYLDYGENEKIKQLSDKITEGMTTDIEKAQAIEMYFINNDFNYDLDYRKEVGENVLDFLFDTKRGVCYEYATAMTLLSRAAGIPARYCEGYNMQTKPDGFDSDEYLITSLDGHGFPELYIKGSGWITFEPTRTNMADEGEQKSITALLSNAGIWILAAAVLVLLGIMIYPAVSNKIFLTVVKRRSPDTAVPAVIRRICRLYGISKASSVREAEQMIYHRAGAGIVASAEAFERSQYGGETLTDTDRTNAVNEYISAYEALRKAKKAERKLKRKSA